MATLLTTPVGPDTVHIEHTETAALDEPAVFTLDDNGMIRNCNKAATRLLGCSGSQLAWQHVSCILPQLSATTLMQDGHINPRLRFLSRIGHRFQLAIPDGNRRSGRIFLNDLDNAGRRIVRLIVYPDGLVPQAESVKPH